jgi:hypothetical protein
MSKGIYIEGDKEWRATIFAQSTFPFGREARRTEVNARRVTIALEAVSEQAPSPAELLADIVTTSLGHAHLDFISLHFPYLPTSLVCHMHTPLSMTAHVTRKLP